MEELELALHAQTPSEEDPWEEEGGPAQGADFLWDPPTNGFQTLFLNICIITFSGLAGRRAVGFSL